MFGGGLGWFGGVSMVWGGLGCFNGPLSKIVRASVLACPFVVYMVFIHNLLQYLDSICQSKKEGNDQESLQLSNTPDPG